MIPALTVAGMAVVWLAISTRREEKAKKTSIN
jgi:hypothetical protein